MKRSYRKHDQRQHTECQRGLRQQRAVEAELNRPLTQAELEELMAEIVDAVGRPLTQAEISGIMGENAIRLVWVNPYQH